MRPKANVEAYWFLDLLAQPTNVRITVSLLNDGNEPEKTHIKYILFLSVCGHPHKSVLTPPHEISIALLIHDLSREVRKQKGIIFCFSSIINR